MTNLTTKIFIDATDPILIENLDGKVIDMNAEAERSYGWTREELRGLPIKTIVPPDRHHQADDLLARCKSGEEVRNIEGLRWNKDGNIFPVLLTLSLLKDKTGKAVGIATFAKDISAQKQAESELNRYKNHLKELVTKRTLELEEKKNHLAELSSELSKYLSPQIYESIFAGKRHATIESRRKKLTIFFSDIVNFTQTTERMEPEEITQMLNTYLGEMAKIAIKYGGTIDKYVGDAVMIFFGDPQTKGVREDALACVSMSIEMITALKNLQKAWYNKGITEPFSIRIGINTGYCTVGNFGSPEKMDYTIIGSQVNVAARLEELSLEDQILISHETYSLVKDKVFCMKKHPVVVKGISNPIQTYQVIEFHDKLKRQDILEPIGVLAEPASPISPDTLVRDIQIGRRLDDPFVGIVVMDKEEPVGLVMNYHLQRILGSYSHREKYFNQPVSQIMDISPLIVDFAEPINDVANKIINRESSKIYDHIIVKNEERLSGIARVSRILERTISGRAEKN